MLDPDTRLRHARHLLLTEIGEQGQMRLSTARVALPDEVHPRAAAELRDYLERAGVRCAPEGTPAVNPGTPGDELDSEAEAVMRGCFAAVETIKQLLGVGTPAVWSTSEPDQ